jgi:hypothetical protein
MRRRLQKKVPMKNRSHHQRSLEQAHRKYYHAFIVSNLREMEPEGREVQLATETVTGEKLVRGHCFSRSDSSAFFKHPLSAEPK